MYNTFVNVQQLLLFYDNQYNNCTTNLKEINLRKYKVLRALQALKPKNTGLKGIKREKIKLYNT